MHIVIFIVLCKLNNFSHAFKYLLQVEALQPS